MQKAIPDSSSPEFLSKGGSMGEMIRSYNWSSTSLGPVHSWPQSLRSAVSICLNSNFPIAIYWGKDLTLLYNDAWSSIPGNKHPWSLGKPAREVWPDIWDAIAPQFDKAFKGEPGGSKDALLPMQRHGYTEECYFDFTFTPVYGETGSIDGVFNAVIETTYRVINERRSSFLKNFTLAIAEAKDKAELFRNIIQQIRHAQEDIPFAMLYVKDDAGVRFLSSTFKDDGELLIKKPLPFGDLFKSGKPLFISNINRYYGDIPEISWPEEIKEGYVLPLSQTNGELLCCLVVALSARRRFDDDYKNFFDNLGRTITTGYSVIATLDEERKKAHALAEIDKAKTLFFSNISHEFRTPLTLMLGSLEEMMRQPQVIGQENVESLKTSHRNALRLLRLVNNLLDFSRIEAGRSEANYQLTDIVNFTEEVASGFRSLIEQSGLSFTFSYKEIREPVYVDRSMWEKIVLNLISNAFKYTLKGKISVSIRSMAGHFEMSVSDTGIGIPEKDLPRMFERFHRVENNTGRTHEGTGIGLSLVAELVRLHHGQISVKSQFEKGSVFTVTMPTGKKHLPAERVTDTDMDFHAVLSDAFVNEAAALDESPVPQSNGREMKDEVLVVDDNADMRRYFQKLLEKEFNVIMASNGQEALEKLNESVPEIVVSDVMMPVMDGIQLLKEIKSHADTANLPVILVSARAGEESTAEGLDVGADDYLVKPFSSRELLSRVKSQIKISKAHREFADRLERLVAERTEELRTKNADLENTQSFLQQLIDSSVEYISVFDTALQYITVNKRYEEVIGLSRTEIYGKHFLDLHPSAAGTRQLEYVKRALNGESGYLSNRNAIERPELYVDTYFVPLMLQHEIRGVIVLARDVTEIVKSEQLLKEKNIELERSNDDLQQFAHVASHDLKEPVRKVRMFGSRLRDEFKHVLPEKALGYLDKMDKAVNRMYEMIEGVLKYSSLNSVQQTAEPVDLNTVFEEIKSDLELLIGSRDAVIDHTSLPVIPGSRILLYQLFYNLVNNSLKFSKASEKSLVNIDSKIITGKEVPNDYAEPNLNYHEIIVRDNGIGFNQGDAEKIFQSFSRLNSKDKYEGTGLGLALCKKIVERHKGFISATGEEGKGATFRIYLPA